MDKRDDEWFYLADPLECARWKASIDPNEESHPLSWYRERKLTKVIRSAEVHDAP